ncbi:TonB-dependent receptor, partial [Vibrio sp. FNV 38]|nr:TonB-dependent receptor [Vibrio sp. FNV 38]
VVGNPDIHWETVKKTNIGIDYSLFDGLLAGNIEIFRDKRTDILVNGNERAVPNYYGAKPSWVNKGEVETNGYEIELRFNKTLANSLRLWANMNMTHAENEIIIKDDAPLKPAYQRAAGYAIGQTHAHLDKGMM